MEYFFLSLCLVAFWTGGSYGEVVHKPKVSQYPESVNIGDVVNLTCTVTVPGGLGKMADKGIKWMYGNGTTVDGESDWAEIDQTIMDKDKNKATSVLHLTTEGDHWPKVLCQVTYHDKTIAVLLSDIFWINLTVVSNVLIYPRDSTAEQGDQVNLTCAVEGSFIPLDNPWSDSNGPLEEANVKVSRIPPQSTSGVVVWILQFLNVSSRHFGNYTFRVPGRKEISASITPKINPDERVTPAASTGTTALPPAPSQQLSLKDLLNHLVNLSCSSPDLDQTETATAVPIGMTATVSCTATFPNEVNMTDANTYWQDDDEIPLTKSYKGVVNISVSEPSDYSISSVLQVQASVISGAKWPKQLTYVADVVLPDGGEFTLKSKPYFINIVVATNVSVSNEVVDVKLGENCTITCTATGDNVPSTTPWWHKGKLFNANDDDSITVNTVPLQDTIGVMSTITFDKLTEDQLNGSYICQAENENAAVTLVKAVPLSVQVRPKGETNVKVGEAFTIMCEATGVKIPATSGPIASPWMYKGDVVEEDSGAKTFVTTVPLQDATGIMSNITFAPLAANQLGNYTCWAGSESDTVTLVEVEESADTAVPTNGTTTATPVATTGSTEAPTSNGSVGTTAIAIAVIVLLVLCGAVSLVYWKRQMLRDWLMDKDVVKVIKKQRRGKGYKYNKLPRDISTSMKHLE